MCSVVWCGGVPSLPSKYERRACMVGETELVVVVAMYVVSGQHALNLSLHHSSDQGPGQLEACRAKIFNLVIEVKYLHQIFT